MQHYDFARRFRTIYDKAVALYVNSQRSADSFFSLDERNFLTANGITAQHIYDYAEDQNAQNEPGYEIALGIEMVRRDYFLNAQGGKASTAVLDESKLAPKDDAVRGIGWLPRIIPKTKAKLRGELPASLMYCCGGDRRFFKAHDINPAEFLNLVWRHEINDAAIIDWVASRSAAAKAAA